MQLSSRMGSNAARAGRDLTSPGGMGCTPAARPRGGLALTPTCPGLLEWTDPIYFLMPSLASHGRSRSSRSNWKLEKKLKPFY